MLIFVLFGCTQKKTDKKPITTSNDSLSSYFTLANDFNLSRQKRLSYIMKANEIVINQENDSLNRVNLFKIANRYFNINNWKGYKESVNLVLENSEKVSDTVSMAKGYGYLGDYYRVKSISDSSFLFYYKAEKMYDKLNDKYQLAKTLVNKADLLFRVGDLIGSEKEIFRVLRIIKDDNNDIANEINYDANNILGMVYNSMNEYGNAISYHKKALKTLDKMQIIGKNQTMAISYLNLGLVYVNLKNYKVANYYFSKGIEQQNIDNQDPSIYALLLDNLGYSKFKLQDNDGLPQLFYKSLKIRDSLNLNSEIISNKIHLSEYYSSKNDETKSLQFANEALILARKINRSREKLLALKQITVVDTKNASSYTKEYIRINEELQKEERKMGEKFSRIQYDTDQIKGENSTLETKNRNLVYFFSGLTILGLFFYIIKSQKAKNRELLYKQQQQKANEDIYNLMISQQNTIEANRVKEKKRVAQELHDGVLGRMFGVRMNLEGLNRFNDDLAVNQRNDYLSELKNIEQDIREISHDLNREKSELINNFVAIVDNLFEEQRKTFSCKLFSSIDSNIKWDLAINSVKINLYRIIQESLQNINKYANATNVKVELKKQENSIILTITDDGVGFNVNLKKKGIGLQNMISRAKECNGEFNVKSKKGEGTTITVTIPLE
ncbi:tetratricopeptide repeat-containing sensor histidine kinase [Flavobacterium undicola]|uniref:tetratricopeptide repeat-containing sensor histidine kinase n=1 Tax=Flavobacterium undicola TaxID=1932779 RepID=UPI001379049E|nr:tetratricopeptide repeat-containing sensor histidine kinase [Flavobacterium undicola]MBA0885391.1 sensor histidine kinase [Flavobacterium undicola]